MKAFVVCMFLWLASGCGLYAEAPEFGSGCVEGAACGACDLGRMRCEVSEAICDFGPLAEAIDETTQCSAILFLQEGAAGTTGTREDPVGELEEALVLGEAQGVDVLLMSGDFAGPLRVRNGIQILGGLDGTFAVRDGVSTIRAESDEEHVVCMEAAGIERPTVVQSVRCEAIGGGVNFYGARVRDSTGLRLLDVSLFAGAGMSGAEQTAAEPGADGATGVVSMGNGVAGVAGLNDMCPQANGGSGGSGANASGGGNSASRGESSAAGVPGGLIGADGGDGEDGDDGEDGSPAMLGSIGSGEWIQPSGGAGSTGESGAGGSGGGGGAATTGVGGGGGGGGSGGCGGMGGDPGSGGGASIGLILIHSELVEFSGSVTSSKGGDGENGAVGGSGGTGGGKGLGSSGQGDGEAGGRGGTGANGGRGGDGAFGLGGPSVGIWCVESTMETDVELNITSGQGGTSHDGTLALSETMSECE